MKLLIAACLLFAGVALGQQVGNQQEETHPPLSITNCEGGSCSQESGSVVLDANWRWTHKVDDYVNCYEGTEWDSEFCPDPAACAENCAIDGADYSGTYGITASGDELTLKFKVDSNIGSRVYLMDSSDSEYRMFNLLNKEFAFTVDVSEIDCGINGAVYFVEMDADGGLSEFEGNNAGAAYGTGYCDAQCPHDIKFIAGEANIIDWDTDAAMGHYGICCSEMDVWEANKISQAYTVHACEGSGSMRCEGTDCGDNASDERYDGVCDKDGCDWASYRTGVTDFYGPGSEFTIDTTQPLTQITQYITDDGTDNGNLVEVRRIYVQNGQTIENNKMNVDGVSSDFDSLTDESCKAMKTAFNDYDSYSEKGGMAAMGESMRRGMVLVLSLWDDHEAYMLWLDSNYPLDRDPSEPGVARGTCSEDSGRPEDVENEQPNAQVKFSDIRFGDIGSTYSNLKY